jgi:carbamoyl-phosphate synthase small subunit
MKGQLIMENGMAFEGTCFGEVKDSRGEVVFNTGMTGYQEILTDPSYFGQIVVMTYPLIGNYGINFSDVQSTGIKANGLVVKEVCEIPSNWRSEMDLDSYMKEEGVIGIKGVDTRQITRIIRQYGTMRGMITTTDLKYDQIKKMFNFNPTAQAVNNVSTKQIVNFDGKGAHLAVLDLGVKTGIINELKKRDCRITMFPAHTDDKEIMRCQPDGLFITNGPGDPKELIKVIDTVKKLVGVMPILGICLGHQIIALACGADTEKMRFGHRGSNHPVKSMLDGRVMITSQNHGYMVKPNSVPKGFTITHTSLNDGSIEGLFNSEKKTMGVQFHPEASPGPKESSFIFDSFLKMIIGDHICH